MTRRGVPTGRTPCAEKSAHEDGARQKAEEARWFQPPEAANPINDDLDKELIKGSVGREFPNPTNDDLVVVQELQRLIKHGHQYRDCKAIVMGIDRITALTAEVEEEKGANKWLIARVERLRHTIDRWTDDINSSAELRLEVSRLERVAQLHEAAAVEAFQLRDKWMKVADSLRSTITKREGEIERLRAALKTIADNNSVPLPKTDGESLDVTAAKLLYTAWADGIEVASAALNDGEVRDAPCVWGERGTGGICWCKTHNTWDCWGLGVRKC